MSQRHIRFVLLALLVLVVILVVSAASASARPPKFPAADSVYLNGSVLTYGEDRWQSAVVVDESIIKYVGNDTQAGRYIGAATEVVDLHGRMMMPGMQDGHTHLMSFVACNMGWEGGTEDYVLAKIKAALLRDDQIGMLNSNYVLNCSYFFGESMMPIGTLLTRDMLDRLSLPVSSGDPMATGTTRPIVVRNADGHKYHVNSIAINNAGITRDTVAPPGSTIGHYADGEPNGFFADYSPPLPWGDPAPTPPNATYIGWRNSIQLYNQKGTTTVMRPGGSAANCAVWKQMADNGELTVRVNQALSTGWVRGETDPEVLAERIAAIDVTRALYNGYTNPNSPGSLTVDTAKILVDGVVEYPAQTAAMLEPYNINIGTEEDPIWVPGTLRGEDPSAEDATLGFLMLDEAGWSIHVHAIGNRGVRTTLDNFEAINETNPWWDRRDTIVHVQFVDPTDMPRFGSLGVIPNMQLQWAERDTYTVDYLQPYVSPEVYKTMYPARSLMKGGAVLAGGSDWPVDPLAPWKQIETAARRECEPDEMMGIYAGALNYRERVSLMDAIKMHTIGTAYQLHQDDMTGSIEVGKLADLIVLDQNLFKIPVGQISNTKVLLTTLGGQVVWEDPANPI